MKINSLHKCYLQYPEYGSFNAMKQRCYNRKHKNYALYGGRGIRVSKDWRFSFETFLADMGPKPGPDYSIDRIDTNGHYCKENCKWSTQKEQCNNKRTNNVIDHHGDTFTLTQWAEKLNMKRESLAARLKIVPTIAEAVAYKRKTPKFIPYAEKGESNFNAKITESQVIQIRALGGQHTQMQLAKMFSIGKSQVSNILRRKSWTHI